MLLSRRWKTRMCKEALNKSSVMSELSWNIFCFWKGLKEMVAQGHYFFILPLNHSYPFQLSYFSLEKPILAWLKYFTNVISWKTFLIRFLLSFGTGLRWQTKRSNEMRWWSGVLFRVWNGKQPPPPKASLKRDYMNWLCWEMRSWKWGTAFEKGT